MIETLIKQIEKVIALLEQRLIDDPDSPVLKTLYDRYVKSKEILTNNYDINKILSNDSHVLNAEVPISLILFDNTICSNSTHDSKALSPI